MEQTSEKSRSLELIIEGIKNPKNEFTPIPFWFLNDTLTKEELIHQIHDFYNKGVNGFVIHPRIGVPKELVYLSDEFMKYVTIMVEEAKKLNMKVVLYDEAMYPSGSAHGMVVKNHQEYASRGLKMKKAEGRAPSLTLNEAEQKDLLTALAVRKSAEGYELSTVHGLKEERGVIALDKLAEDNEEWAVFAFFDKFTGGHIRGIHFGEDDGEGNEPPSADLLNPDAVLEFMKLTHERYYEVLKEHFGETVIGMFTDEPDIMGRDHEAGLLAWTKDFLLFAQEYKLSENELFLLWEDTSDNGIVKGAVREAAIKAQKKYRTAVNKRMEETYYKPLSAWCEAHNIALTGHPHESDDIGFMKYFQMPAQDVVWRWVAPEDNLGIEGQHSTMAKCTSDSARHRGIRRNGNECFACCGAGKIEWAFTVRDMKWYMDWLFVRGVNLLYPHAFFYSVDGERRFGERPPDVGPNNTWWPFYRQISDYMKRMSFLMTDYTNSASVAILCEAHHLPWKAAKMLFENQIEFNYLEEELCQLSECQIQDGRIIIKAQSYSVVIIEDADRYHACKEVLSLFIKQGGHLVVLDSDEAVKMTGAKAWIAESETALIDQLRSFSADRFQTITPKRSLRMTHGQKAEQELFLFTNEGEELIETKLVLPYTGAIWSLDAFTGTVNKVIVKPFDCMDSNLGTTLHVAYQSAGALTQVPLTLQPRESVVYLMDRKENMDEQDSQPLRSDKDFKQYEIAGSWSMTFEDGRKITANMPLYWNELPDFKNYSGKVVCEIEFIYDKEITGDEKITIGKVHEFARIILNDTDLGVLFWEPFVFDARHALQKNNKLIIECFNTPANFYSKKPLLSGLEDVNVLYYE